MHEANVAASAWLHTVKCVRKPLASTLVLGLAHWQALEIICSGGLVAEVLRRMIAGHRLALRLAHCGLPLRSVLLGDIPMENEIMSPDEIIIPWLGVRAALFLAPVLSTLMAAVLMVLQQVFEREGLVTLIARETTLVPALVLIKKIDFREDLSKSCPTTVASGECAAHRAIMMILAPFREDRLRPLSGRGTINVVYPGRCCCKWLMTVVRPWMPPWDRTRQ